MKDVYTKWQTWAIISGLLLGFIVFDEVSRTDEIEAQPEAVEEPEEEEYQTTKVVSMERRDYMTSQEYEAIEVGMTMDELNQVQDAKPSQDAVDMGGGNFQLMYDGENEGSYVIFTVRKAGTDAGDYILIDKLQSGLF